MRASILALVLFLFVGMAGATNPVPIYNFGPQSGIYVPGVVKTPYLTVDSDATIGGNVAITGTLQAGVTASDTGTIATDVTIAANKFLKCASGTSIFDWSLGSGIFKTTTGAVTIGPGAVGITGAATFSKPMVLTLNTTNTADKTITAATLKAVYEIDASGGTVVLTLPDAATVTGIPIRIAIATDPGANYATIKATASKFGGSGGIAAATGIKDTDVSGGIELISDGTNYLITGQYFPVGGAGWVSG